MPSWAEVRLALQGILKLARFDPDFVRFFDQSPAGALRSFWVVGVAILYNLLTFQIGFVPEVASESRYLLAITVGSAVSAALLPVALLSIAPVMHRETEAIGAITGYNWSNLLWIALAAPLDLLQWSGVSLGTMQILWLTFLLAMLVFEAFLLRNTLRVAWPIAIGIACADIYISQFFLYPLLAHAGAQ